jgi:hypothetical protein
VLSSILRAYAALDGTTGYCQGMNYVAASLLIQMHPTEATQPLFGGIEWQQEVFWLFYVALRVHPLATTSNIFLPSRDHPPMHILVIQ